VVGFYIITNSLLHGHASFKISPESLAFSLLRKCKDYDLQKYDFTLCLYGCVTWSLISKDQSRLRVFVDEVKESY
jgi:hypothetical protein